MRYATRFQLRAGSTRWFYSVEVLVGGSRRSGGGERSLNLGRRLTGRESVHSSILDKTPSWHPQAQLHDNCNNKTLWSSTVEAEITLSIPRALLAKSPSAPKNKAPKKDTSVSKDSKHDWSRACMMLPANRPPAASLLPDAGPVPLRLTPNHRAKPMS